MAAVKTKGDSIRGNVRIEWRKAPQTGGPLFVSYRTPPSHATSSRTIYEAGVSFHTAVGRPPTGVGFTGSIFTVEWPLTSLPRKAGELAIALPAALPTVGLSVRKCPMGPGSSADFLSFQRAKERAQSAAATSPRLHPHRMPGPPNSEVLSMTLPPFLPHCL